jgi:UPF0755 protein
LIRRLLKMAFTLFVVVVLSGAYGHYKLSKWADTPFGAPETGETIIDYPSGTSLSKLTKTLQLNGLIDSSFSFKAFVRLTGKYSKFQAGKYRFRGLTAPNEIINKLKNGDVYWPVLVEFTIPEGFTLEKIANRLAAKGIGHIKELKTILFDPNFAKEMRVPSKTLEGFIYPATYQFIKIPSAPEAIKHMVDTFWKKLPKNYEQDVKKMGLTLKEAVTFASLIELETKRDDERSVISEVIWRRLKDRAPLAIDAALIYGISDYKGDIKWRHLKDAKNPYNTRIYKGLPPTPIGSPARSSLEAVLTPTNTGAYFYVLLYGQDKHHFSKTHKEHNFYVQKLIKASKRKRRRRKSNK